MKHTPLYVSTTHHADGRKTYSLAWDCVDNARPSTWPLVAAENIRDREMAERIVRACNNFEALLEAAKESLSALNRGGNTYANEIEKIEKAISNAEA